MSRETIGKIEQLTYEKAAELHEQYANLPHTLSPEGSVTQFTYELGKLCTRHGVRLVGSDCHGTPLELVTVNLQIKGE